MTDYSAYDRRVRVFVESLSSAMTELIERVASRSMLVAAWQAAAEREIAKHMLAAFMASRGKSSLTQSETDAMRPMLLRQMQYLNSFASEMTQVSWGDFPAKWRRRADQYSTSVVVPFYTGETWGIPLPAMPGDGSSQCGQSDKCTWDIETLPGKGNWNATWKLHPAEHCQTCLERARLWNPLHIRNYQLVIPKAMMLKEISRDAYKHLQGKHDQKTHGRRRTSQSDVSGGLFDSFPKEHKKMMSLSNTPQTERQKSTIGIMDMAYAAGKKYEHRGYKSLNQAIDRDYGIYQQTKDYSRVEMIAFENGIIGGNGKFDYVSAWRFGKVPESGRSTNFRENKLESGLSVMETSSGKTTQDAFSAIFIRSKANVITYVTGIVHPHETGADGEPLLLQVKTIDTEIPE